MTKSINSRFGVTFVIVMLAAFVVVLAVSLATLGWSGPGEYLRVMLTLVVSLLVLIAAALAAVLMIAKRDAGTDPRDKIQRIRIGTDAETDTSDEVLRIRKELDAGIGPSNEILRIRKQIDVMRNNLESLVREAVKQADRERTARHE